MHDGETENDPGEIAYFEHQKRNNLLYGDDVQVEGSDDPEVQEIEAAVEREINRLTARRINPDAPAADILIRERNKRIAAERKFGLYAKGAMPEDGFIDPEGDDTYRPAPKPAKGFAVVQKKNRRASATKADVKVESASTPKIKAPEPVSVIAGPAAGLWSTRRF